MLYMSDIIIQKVLKNATADNIESSLEFFCILVEKLKEVKRKFDNEAPTHPRACKKPMKKLKIEILELVSDDDSSSDYLPSSDSDDSEEDDDEDDDDEDESE